MSESMSDRERAVWWEQRAKEHEAAATYYRDELEKAHALLGRVIHQTSERWDTVNISKYFPTSNLHRKRTVANPSVGEGS